MCRRSVHMEHGCQRAVLKALRGLHESEDCILSTVSFSSTSNWFLDSSQWLYTSNMYSVIYRASKAPHPHLIFLTNHRIFLYLTSHQSVSPHIRRGNPKTWSPPLSCTASDNRAISIDIPRVCDLCPACPYRCPQRSHLYRLLAARSLPLFQ